MTMFDDVEKIGKKLRTLHLLSIAKKAKMWLNTDKYSANVLFAQFSHFDVSVIHIIGQLL